MKAGFGTLNDEGTSSKHSANTVIKHSAETLAARIVVNLTQL